MLTAARMSPARWHGLGLIREEANPTHPCPLPQPPPLPASLLHFLLLFIWGGTVTIVTNHLGIYKEWVPWKEVFGPQGDMEMLRQEPLVSSKGSSDQEWGLRERLEVKGWEGGKSIRIREKETASWDNQARKERQAEVERQKWGSQPGKGREGL